MDTSADRPARRLGRVRARLVGYRTRFGLGYLVVLAFRSLVDRALVHLMPTSCASKEREVCSGLRTGGIEAIALSRTESNGRRMTGAPPARSGVRPKGDTL
jgi:hypothetical protein